VTYNASRWRPFGLAALNLAFLIALIAWDRPAFEDVWATSRIAFAQIAVLFVGVALLAGVSAFFVSRWRMGDRRNA